MCERVRSANEKGRSHSQRHTKTPKVQSSARAVHSGRLMSSEKAHTEMKERRREGTGGKTKGYMHRMCVSERKNENEKEKRING